MEFVDLPAPFRRPIASCADDLEWHVSYKLRREVTAFGGLPMQWERALATLIARLPLVLAKCDVRVVRVVLWPEHPSEDFEVQPDTAAFRGHARFFVTWWGREPDAAVAEPHAPFAPVPYSFGELLNALGSLSDCHVGALPTIDSWIRLSAAEGRNLPRCEDPRHPPGGTLPRDGTARVDWLLYAALDGINTAMSAGLGEILGIEIETCWDEAIQGSFEAVMPLLAAARPAAGRIAFLALFEAAMEAALDVSAAELSAAARPDVLPPLRPIRLRVLAALVAAESDAARGPLDDAFLGGLDVPADGAEDGAAPGSLRDALRRFTVGEVAELFGAGCSIDSTVQGTIVLLRAAAAMVRLGGRPDALIVLPAATRGWSSRCCYVSAVADPLHSLEYALLGAEALGGIEDPELHDAVSSCHQAEQRVWSSDWDTARDATSLADAVARRTACRAAIASDAGGASAATAASAAGSGCDVIFPDFEPPAALPRGTGLRWLTLLSRALRRVQAEGSAQMGGGA